MKHIFFVHTPVTYLGAVAVIRHLDLQQQDSIILFQSFKNTDSANSRLYNSVFIDEHFSNKSYFGKITSLVSGFGIAKKFDKLVTKAAGNEKFIAYVPVVTFVHKLLITHPDCVGFNFIEEGLAQYYTEETLESIAGAYSRYAWRSSLLTQFKHTMQELYLLSRGYNFKLLSLPFSYSCYHAIKDIKFYGYSEQSFPLVASNKRIVLPLVNASFTEIAADIALKLDNSFVWIGDPGVKQHGFSKNTYLQGIENGFIPLLVKHNARHVFIKFHRDEPLALRKEIEALFNQHGFESIVISDEVIMELYLVKAKNVSLTGVYSSLLYYAAVMGHSSYSVFNYVAHEYNRAIAGRNFNFFWEKVRLLEKDDFLN